MSLLGEIPDGAVIYNKVHKYKKDKLLESIILLIKDGIERIHSVEDEISFSFAIKGLSAENIYELCREELTDIRTELISKHYVMEIETIQQNKIDKFLYDVILDDLSIGVNFIVTAQSGKDSNVHHEENNNFLKNNRNIRI